MPRVIGYTPSWLSKPATGHQVFAPATATPTSNGHARAGAETDVPAPRRTIARRGTEVFVAVGREIRWADLLNLKDRWTTRDALKFTASRYGQAVGEDEDEDDDLQAAYRVIKTPVADDIRQLIVSPLGDYMAILTAYTVHIAVLPSASHLTTPDTTPMRLKTFTLGPTTHVTSQSPVVCALWHPLGVNGTCLVTVTEDAIVRLWELSTTDRWSFDSPTLAIDLTKLADGTSLDQDFGAPPPWRSKGFSPDSVEMAVASACFGGRGTGDWSPMTLWIAMREGDVYALCPLLPEKWAPPATLIASLSVSIVSKVAAIEDDPEVSEQQKRLSRQQMAWMSCLDDQEPSPVDSPNGEEPSSVYTRPARPGKIPKLQGPFDIDFAPEVAYVPDDMTTQLSDIFFIGPRTNSDELVADEDFDLEMDDADLEGLSVGVVCLVSRSGRVSVCLDLDGVEAQWLPKRHERSPDTSIPTLLTFDTLETQRSGEMGDHNWPVFSPDVNSRYSFFLTNKSSITFLSLTPWAFRLETELQGQSSAGADFRMDLLVDGERSHSERIYSQDLPHGASAPLSACFVFRDPDLGYFLLSSTSYGPVALTLEPPELEDTNFRARSPDQDIRDAKPLMLWEPRPVYEPSHALAHPSALPAFLADLRRSKYKRMIQEPIRLSPATLTILTDAHKILSEETHRLGASVADLFRQCERLQSELRDQISRVAELAQRVDAVTGDDADDATVATTNAALLLGGEPAVQQRLLHAKKRHTLLTNRFEGLRKRLLHAGRARELSDREKAWFDEVAQLQHAVLGPDPADDATPAQLPVRLRDVQRLQDELVAQARAVAADLSASRDGDGAERDRGPAATAAGFRPSVSAGTRQKKLAEVMTLLERETALVDAAKRRLEQLTVA